MSPTGRHRGSLVRQRRRLSREAIPSEKMSLDRSSLPEGESDESDGGDRHLSGSPSWGGGRGNGNSSDDSVDRRLDRIMDRYFPESPTRSPPQSPRLTPAPSAIPPSPTATFARSHAELVRPSGVHSRDLRPIVVQKRHARHLYSRISGPPASDSPARSPLSSWGSKGGAAPSVTSNGAQSFLPIGANWSSQPGSAWNGRCLMYRPSDHQHPLQGLSCPSLPLLGVPNLGGWCGSTEALSDVEHNPLPSGNVAERISAVHPPLEFKKDGTLRQTSPSRADGRPKPERKPSTRVWLEAAQRRHQAHEAERHRVLHSLAVAAQANQQLLGSDDESIDSFSSYPRHGQGRWGLSGFGGEDILGRALSSDLSEEERDEELLAQRALAKRVRMMREEIRRAEMAELAEEAERAAEAGEEKFVGAASTFGPLLRRPEMAYAVDGWEQMSGTGTEGRSWEKNAFLWMFDTNPWGDKSDVGSHPYRTPQDWRPLSPSPPRQQPKVESPPQSPVQWMRSTFFPVTDTVRNALGHYTGKVSMLHGCNSSNDPSNLSPSVLKRAQSISTPTTPTRSMPKGMLRRHHTLATVSKNMDIGGGGLATSFSDGLWRVGSDNNKEGFISKLATHGGLAERVASRINGEYTSRKTPKIRVLELRSIEDVIPPFGQIHMRLRTHMADRGVSYDTLGAPNEDDCLSKSSSRPSSHDGPKSTTSTSLQHLASSLRNLLQVATRKEKSAHNLEVRGAAAARWREREQVRDREQNRSLASSRVPSRSASRTNSPLGRMSWAGSDSGSQHLDAPCPSPTSSLGGRTATLSSPGGCVSPIPHLIPNQGVNCKPEEQVLTEEMAMTISPLQQEILSHQMELPSQALAPPDAPMLALRYPAAALVDCTGHMGRVVTCASKDDKKFEAPGVMYSGKAILDQDEDANSCSSAGTGSGGNSTTTSCNTNNTTDLFVSALVSEIHTPRPDQREFATHNRPAARALALSLPQAVPTFSGVVKPPVDKRRLPDWAKRWMENKVVDKSLVDSDRSLMNPGRSQLDGIPSSLLAPELEKPPPSERSQSRSINPSELTPIITNMDRKSSLLKTPAGMAPYPSKLKMPKERQTPISVGPSISQETPLQTLANDLTLLSMKQKPVISPRNIDCIQDLPLSNLKPVTVELHDPLSKRQHIVSEESSDKLIDVKGSVAKNEDLDGENHRSANVTSFSPSEEVFAPETPLIGPKVKFEYHTPVQLSMDFKSDARNNIPHHDLKATVNKHPKEEDNGREGGALDPALSWRNSPHTEAKGDDKDQSESEARSKTKSIAGGLEMPDLTVYGPSNKETQAKSMENHSFDHSGLTAESILVQEELIFPILIPDKSVDTFICRNGTDTSSSLVESDLLKDDIKEKTFEAICNSIDEQKERRKNDYSDSLAKSSSSHVCKNAEQYHTMTRNHADLIRHENHN